MQVNNEIYLRRRSKIVVPEGTETLLPVNYVASVVKNAESLGYGFSEDLIAACRALTLEQLVVLYGELMPTLQALRGAHRVFAPMYPNFPTQVMEMSKGELYLNAIVHYWSDGKLLPLTEVKARFPLLDDVELTMIDLGTPEEFESLFGKIAGSNTSLSQQDKDDLTWFAEANGDDVMALLPAAIPQKENVAFVAGLLIRHVSRELAAAFIATSARTATDVLCISVALSDGDLSLAAATKFRTFTRPERGLILAQIESLPNVVEDMLRWKKRWIRLGEKLHPGEYAAKYPNTARAFAILRNDEPFPTFNGQIEGELAEKDVAGATTQLRTRPGDFARRLDHLLRLSGESQADVIAAFADVAAQVSTPVLLQLRQHFAVRNDRSGLRVFFPKGAVAKAQGIENTLPPLADDVCQHVIHACDDALTARFAELPTLGKVYVDPQLANYKAPFAMRSASKALRTLVRGSRLPLPLGDVLRFFIWWKNGTARTDIDLSATMFNDKFEYVDVLAYYNLAGFGGVHSGDIVDAPTGASEFIDVSLDKLSAASVRYVAMTLHSYTRQSFVELPECFAGWMIRQVAGSGEIFEPKTVQDRLDLTADTKVAIPLVIDVRERQIIWCDMSLKSYSTKQNNVNGTLSGLGVTLSAFANLKKPNLYDLFTLHGKARGELVETAAEADTIFSVESGTPFRLEEIAADYMA